MADKVIVKRHVRRRARKFIFGRKLRDVPVEQEKPRSQEDRLQDVYAALEKRATEEEMQAFRAQLDAELQLAESLGKVQKAEKEQDLKEQIEAEVSLDDLERTMKTLEKEEKEAKAARERAEKVKNLVPAEISSEELKSYEVALDEYARKIGKVQSSEDVRQLAKGLTTLRADIQEKGIPDEERAERITEFVKVAKRARQKRTKK